MNQTSSSTQAPFESQVPPIHELHLSKDAEEWLKSFSPGVFTNYKDIETTWNYPLTQFSMTLVKDPLFRNAVSEISFQQKTGTLMGYELLWVLFIWILRAYRLQKAATWLLKLWTQAWVSVLLWFGLLLVIPYFAWGAPFRVALVQFVKALIRHFFA